MSIQSTPLRLNLKRDEQLEIEWQDGLVSVYPLTLLRSMCPCAACRAAREQEQTRPKGRLTVLSGPVHSGPPRVVDAELVGGYALRLEWSDNHGSGIYSFQYLRELSPQKR